MIAVCLNQNCTRPQMIKNLCTHAVQNKLALMPKSVIVWPLRKIWDFSPPGRCNANDWAISKPPFIAKALSEVLSICCAAPAGNRPGVCFDTPVDALAVKAIDGIDDGGPIELAPIARL